MPRIDEKIDDLNPINDRVLVTNLEFGMKKTVGGIILLDDDGKEEGIRPRWAKVWKVGPKQKELIPGDYILIEHGRWTRKFEVNVADEDLKIFMIDYPTGVILISKSKPDEIETGVY